MSDTSRTPHHVYPQPTACPNVAPRDDLAALRAELDAAARRFDELARLCCSITFNTPPTGSVEIALRDRDGNVTRLLGPAETLAIAAGVSPFCGSADPREHAA